MISMGKSVYEDCQAKAGELACPFKPETRAMTGLWCRACLLAKIHSLRNTLRRLGVDAVREADSQY